MLIALTFLLGACGATRDRVIASHGVRVTIPNGWQEVRAASDLPVSDPRTLLVVGTAGVRTKASRCLITAYRIPASAAAVVVVGWTSLAAAGGVATKPGRAPLGKLVAVRRPSFECFAGRGAVADVVLGGRLYQVNVLVGDRASAERVEQTLAVARSFDRAR